MAYLISEEAATEDNCYPAKRSRNRALPNVTVHTKTCLREKDDPNTGNRICEVEITVRTNASQDNPPQAQETEATKSEALRLASDILTAGVFDALNLQGQAADLLCDGINAAAAAKAIADPTNHGDLANFSCLGIEHVGEDQGFNEQGVWEDAITLKILCCPSNKA